MNKKSFLQICLSKLGFSVNKLSETETDAKEFESVVENEDDDEKTDKTLKVIHEDKNGREVVKIHNAKEAILYYLYYETTKKDFGLIGWIILLPLIITWRFIQLLYHILIIIFTILGCA